MGNQGHLPKLQQSQCSSLHCLDDVQRIELVLARSMTAIVKSGGFVAFSDAKSGWVFDRFSSVTRASRAQASMKQALASSQSPKENASGRQLVASESTKMRSLHRAV
jgi:hypothetical protein